MTSWLLLARAVRTAPAYTRRPGPHEPNGTSVSGSRVAFTLLGSDILSRASRLLDVWTDEIDLLVRREAEYGLEPLRPKQLGGLIEQVLIADV